MHSYTIGITGHRSLPVDATKALRQGVRRFLTTCKDSHPETGLVILSSLAQGADTLCAQEGLALGMRLVVPLPLSREAYNQDFSPAAAEDFHRLLALAAEAFVAPPSEAAGEKPSRGFFYRQAGIYVAQHCDVLLALWDGIRKDTPDGAGTWETVKLAEAMGKRVEVLWHSLPILP